MSSMHARSASTSLSPPVTSPRDLSPEAGSIMGHSLAATSSSSRSSATSSYGSTPVSPVGGGRRAPPSSVAGPDPHEAMSRGIDPQALLHLPNEYEPVFGRNPPNTHATNTPTSPKSPVSGGENKHCMPTIPESFEVLPPGRYTVEFRSQGSETGPAPRLVRLVSADGVLDFADPDMADTPLTLEQLQDLLEQFPAAEDEINTAIAEWKASRLNQKDAMKKCEADGKNA